MEGVQWEVVGLLSVPGDVQGGLLAFLHGHYALIPTCGHVVSFRAAHRFRALCQAQIKQ